MKKTQTKGKNFRFGFYINRPFWIMSKLPMRRVVESVGGGSNTYIKTLSRHRKTQKWIFNQRTKTIENVGYRGRSMNIYSNGGSSRLHITTTNSRWW